MRSGHREALIGVIFAAVIWLYWPSLQTLLTEWANTQNRTYTHGYLVAATSLWLVWRRRTALAAADARPIWWLVPVLLAAGIGSVVLRRAGIQIGHQLLFPVLIWAGACAALGWKSGRLLLFPVAFLYTAVPLWSHFNGVLQESTIVAVRLLLRATGITAHFSGEQVQIPSGSFHIEDGCSGLHFLIVAVALAALLGELQASSIRERLRLLLIAVVCAVLANWVRVYIIILAGYLTDMQHYLVSKDHYVFGWVVFVLAMLPLFLTRPRRSARGNLAGNLQPPRFAGAAPSIIWPALAVLLALAAAPALAWFRGGQAAGRLAEPIRLPQRIDAWSRAEGADAQWQPRFTGTDAEQRVAYQRDGRRVEVYAGTIAAQQQGREILGEHNSPTLPMMVTQSQRLHINGVPVRELQATDAVGRGWLIWASYRVGKRTFASGGAAQLWYGWISLFGAAETAILLVATTCREDCPSMRSALTQVLDATGPLEAGER